MNISAKIVADSRALGARLTSYIVTIPRFMLAELNTHRDLSRNSASSRAIPVERRLASIRENPFVPLAFAANKRGMQAGELLDERDNSKAQGAWLRLRDAACDGVEGLLDQGVHKQWGNRPLEPYAWHTVLLTATEWDNFFNLRTHHAAQPEFIELATQMRDLYRSSTPRKLRGGQWHLPLITEDERAGLIDLYVDGTYTERELVKVSVGRCAALSYERHDDQRDFAAWTKLHDTLRSVGHMSPFEHQACLAGGGWRGFTSNGREDRLGRFWTPPFAPVYALRDAAYVEGHSPVPDDTECWEISHYKCGNFRAPFLQYRKTLPGEAVWQGESP